MRSLYARLYSQCKKIFAALLLVGCLSATLVSISYGQASQWSPPEELGPGWFPDITTDVAGRVHAVWSSSIVLDRGVIPSQPAEEINAYDVVMYASKIGGGAWDLPVDIAALRQKAGTEVTRPAILVDEDGLFHLTFRDVRIYYSNTPVSLAASAKSWTEPYPMNVDQVGYFSRLARDSAGVLHAVFTENVRTPQCSICYHVFYRNSVDGGRNWSIRTDISMLPTGAAKPQILIDPQDNLHVVWEAGRGGAYGQLSDPTTAMYASSTDGGETWSRPVEFIVPNGQAKKITLGLDGLDNLVVVWLALPEDALYYQYSSDYGRSWSSPASVPGAYGAWKAYPSRLDVYSMAVDSAGRLHLVAAGSLNREGSSVDLIHSVWNGIGWAQPEVIAAYSGDVPEWPRLAVSNGNQMHVVWFVRDEAHIFESDRGDYRVWTASKSLSSPYIPSRRLPTPMPTAEPALPDIMADGDPTPTPPNPHLELTPVSPQVARAIYTEMDEMATIAMALVPAAVFILGVFALIRIRRQ